MLNREVRGLFYSQVEIIKIMTPGGKRIGAILCQAGQPDILLSSQDIYLLGDRLNRSNSHLLNAFITVDGRIRSRTGKSVQIQKMDEQTFLKMYRPLQLNSDSVEVRTPKQPPTQPPTQPLTKPPTQPVRGATQENMNSKKPVQPHSVVQRFNRYAVRPNTTELRLGSIIEEGIRLAGDAGIKVRITKIQTATTKERKDKPYMTVSAVCEQLTPNYTQDIKFEAKLNGKVLLSVWKSAPPQETSVDDIYSLFEANASQGDTLETVQCKTSYDIFLILYYYVTSNRPELRNRSLVEKAELVQRESFNELLKLPTPITYVYPHKRIEGTFKNHIQSLEHLRAELNARFEGTYSFIWQIQDTSAILSVVGYDSIRQRQSIIEAEAAFREKVLKKFSEDASADRLKATKVPTATELLNDIKTEALVELHLKLTPTPAGNTVAMRHRLLRENRLWISLEEHLRMWYVDEVCDAVQFIMDEVLKQGFIRGSISVIAYGKLNSKDYYLLSDRPNPVSAEELLALREKYLIEGVAFRKLPDGTFGIIDNLDRDGDVLPKFAEHNGSRYIFLTYEFRDTKADEPVTLSTAIPWGDYQSFKNLVRREQVALKTPQQMVGELTIAPNKQLNAINPLSKKLAEYAKARFYSPAEAVELVQDFMLCFRYSRLMDVLRSNRTPLEMLVDRKGCCLELSLLASVILSRMGFESAVIFSYSPALDTRYHAVSGVKVQAEEVAYDEEVVSLENVDVMGYKALEFTLGRKCSVGTAFYWAKAGKWSCAIDGSWGETDPRQISQTVLVTLNSTMKPNNVAFYTMCGGVPQLIPFDQLYWQNVLGWFNDKQFVPQS